MAKLNLKRPVLNLKRPVLDLKRPVLRLLKEPVPKYNPNRLANATARKALRAARLS